MTVRWPLLGIVWLASSLVAATLQLDGDPLRLAGDTWQAQLRRADGADAEVPKKISSNKRGAHPFQQNGSIVPNPAGGCQKTPQAVHRAWGVSLIWVISDYLMMRGLIHSAQSCPELPLADTWKRNLTFLPASEDRSISRVRTLLS